MIKNLKIKEVIAKSRLKHYEIATALGIRDTSFSRMLREELTESQFIRVLDAIKKIQKGDENAATT